MAFLFFFGDQGKQSNMDVTLYINIYILPDYIVYMFFFFFTYICRSTTNTVNVFRVVERGWHFYCLPTHTHTHVHSLLSSNFLFFSFWSSKKIRVHFTVNKQVMVNKRQRQYVTTKEKCRSSSFFFRKRERERGLLRGNGTRLTLLLKKFSRHK